jgi:CheY-like chemotaxis protein
MRKGVSIACRLREDSLKPLLPPCKPKIAVIDDDHLIRYLLDLHLRRAGYEVFAAEDAVAGAHMVLEQVPDLIVCDVEMPYMSGVEFVSALRADPTTRGIPVVFLTVKNDAEQNARQLGAGFLVKPVTVDELLRTVARFAPRPAACTEPL